MLHAAASVRENAQAPYSHYWVGVAVLSNGRYYRGCNVERASWTQTSHAEQNAIDSMVAALGPSKIEALSLVAAPENVKRIFPPVKTGIARAIEEIPVPCGHCLQIIWENCFQDPDVRIYSLMSSGEIGVITVGNAFPLRFGPEHLGVYYGSKK